MAPRSWPSWPILATSMRGLRPSRWPTAPTPVLRPVPGRIVRPGAAVNALHRRRHRAVAAEHILQRQADLAQRAARPRRLDRKREQVRVALRAVPQRIERGPGLRRVPLRPRLRQPRDLAGADPVIVDVEDVEMILLVLAVAVDADDHRLAAVDPGGARRGGLLDPPLRHALRDRIGHAAERLDLLDQRPGLVGQLVASGSRHNRSRRAGRRHWGCRSPRR